MLDQQHLPAFAEVLIGDFKLIFSGLALWVPAQCLTGVSKSQVDGTG